MADAEEVLNDDVTDVVAHSSPVIMLVLSRFTRAILRCKHERKHKTKERLSFLVLALMLASPQFTRCFLALQAV